MGSAAGQDQQTRKNVEANERPPGKHGIAAAVDKHPSREQKERDGKRLYEPMILVKLQSHDR